MGVYKMAINVYSKTVWADGTAPSLSKTQLDHIETGIKDVNTAVIALQSVQSECELYASDASDDADASATSASQSLASAGLSQTYANNSSNSADRAQTVVDGAISASVSASVSASIIAIQPSVTASATSASNAYISESNTDLSETACLNYKNIMDDAISTNIPSFTFNPTTGHLAYTGGTINFSLNTEKHLLWEVQL